MFGVTEDTTGYQEIQDVFLTQFNYWSIWSAGVQGVMSLLMIGKGKNKKISPLIVTAIKDLIIVKFLAASKKRSSLSC